MVMDFNLGLNSTSVIITTIVTFHWGKGLLLVFLSHIERLALKSNEYSHTKYVSNYYSEEEFNSFKATSSAAVTYNIYHAFYTASVLVAIIIFEAFELLWQLTVMLGVKLKFRDESLVTLLYLMLLRTSFLIIYLPINLVELRVTQQGLGNFLFWLLLLYIRDLFLISVFSIPGFHLIKALNKNIIVLIWATYSVLTIAKLVIDFNIFLSLEPLEDGPLKRILEEKVLPEIDFSIDDIHHSNDEVNEKVYWSEKWIRKTLVISGPLPTDKNVSLIGATSNSVQYTIKEVLALIILRIGESSRGYIVSAVLSTEVHLFTLMLACWHLYEKEYILKMAGFRWNKPVIANLVVVWFFVIQPYWTIIRERWRTIYDFTQLTEAQFMVSHFSLQNDLISALVKLYKSNKEFPCHNYWYAIFVGYRRPLHSLLTSLAPPNVS